jgi:hypothetical protein
MGTEGTFFMLLQTPSNQHEDSILKLAKIVSFHILSNFSLIIVITRDHS